MVIQTNMSHPSLMKDILHTINTMTDDIFDGMDIDANPNSIKGEAAPTVEEIISQFQGNDLHELTTPPKLQHQSPKDSMSGTPRKSQSQSQNQQNWQESGQNTPVRSSYSQNMANLGNQPSSGIKQEYSGPQSNNSNNTSINNSTSNISNWAHGGWDSGIASAQQTNGVPSVATRSIHSTMPKQWGIMNNHNSNQSYAQSEMSIQSRFSLPSIASTANVNNNQDAQSQLSWTGSDAPSGAPSRSGSRYPPMVPSNFPPQLIVRLKNSK